MAGKATVQKHRGVNKLVQMRQRKNRRLRARVAAANTATITARQAEKGAAAAGRFGSKTFLRGQAPDVPARLGQGQAESHLWPARIADMARHALQCALLPTGARASLEMPRSVPISASVRGLSLRWRSTMMRCFARRQALHRAIQQFAAAALFQIFQHTVLGRCGVVCDGIHPVAPVIRARLRCVQRTGHGLPCGPA